MSNIQNLLDNDAKKILNFWFSPQIKEKWFSHDIEFDETIINNFMHIYQNAKNGYYDEWVTLPEELLALIIIFDQFPRNMFRGTKQAYETDIEALELAKYAINYQMDEKLPTMDYRMFIYMPFMHSENIYDQEISVEKFKLVSKESLKYAIKHQEIIRKFGRFPHRNIFLNRKSTDEEIDFLRSHESKDW